MTLLNEADGMKKLITFLEENIIFDDEKAIGRETEKFKYRIETSKWTKLTGIDKYDLPQHPSHDRTGNFQPFQMPQDGVIWVDRYFDADYKDYDLPERYVYLSLF
jgi:hypothetical protein